MVIYTKDNSIKENGMEEGKSYSQIQPFNKECGQKIKNNDYYI